MRPALAVAAAAALVFLPSLGGPFQFDDWNVIVGDPAVHSWSAYFDRAAHGVRPLLKATYTLNWTLGGGFHLFNLMLHALNAALLFLVGTVLFKNPAASLLAALAFALHPVQTEAVTYISGRSTSLMAAFYLGAMLAYLRGAHWFFSSLLFLLALAVRETAVTLPAALLLAELCRVDRPPMKEILRKQWPHWTLLAAALVFVLFSPRYFQLVAYGFGERGLADNLITQVGGVSYLVSRLVLLNGFNIDPALPTLTEWTPVLIFQFILFLTLFLLALANLRARPWLAFGILWFFLQLAPTNSFVPRLDVANERQLYLACWGLFLALSLQAKINFRLAVPILLAFTVTCISRQLDYRSEIALWEASVAQAPWNPRAHNNLGYAYQLAGRTADARREYQAALLFDPGHRKARLNLYSLPRSKDGR